jgi:hypothetical protein
MRAFMKSENDFELKYTYKNVESIYFDESQVGMLETYGEDFKKLSSYDPQQVWTMIDSDMGMCLVAGLRFVNRIYHVVTNEKWEDENEEFLFQKYEV